MDDLVAALESGRTSPDERAPCPRGTGLGLPAPVALCDLPRGAPPADHRHRLRSAGGSFFLPEPSPAELCPDAVYPRAQLASYPPKKRSHRPENAQHRHSITNAPAKPPQNTQHVPDCEKCGLRLIRRSRRRRHLGEGAVIELGRDQSG